MNLRPSSPDPLDLHSLGGGPLRRAVKYFPECESTNDAARALANAGEPEGALAVTDFQTAGRGRMGRVWQAPRGSSLLFSLLLRPPIRPAQALLPVMAVSLGVMEGIRRACGLPARLKWPNDILIRGKKAGGILCELGLNGPGLKYVIAGVGLNVNFDPRGVAGIPEDSTSIQMELGRGQPRAGLLRAILEEIEPRYRKIVRGESLRGEWAGSLATLGRRVLTAMVNRWKDLRCDGWITADTADHYRKGITVSMQFFGITEAKIGSYLNESLVKFDPAKAMELINTQKYLSYFLNSGWEAFFNQRRTGIPVFAIGPYTQNGGEIPKRWMYPQSELDTNFDNVADAINRQYGGNDNVNGLMWLLEPE